MVWRKELKKESAAQAFCAYVKGEEAEMVPRFPQVYKPTLQGFAVSYPRPLYVSSEAGKMRSFKALKT